MPKIIHCNIRNYNILLEKDSIEPWLDDIASKRPANLSVSGGADLIAKELGLMMKAVFPQQAPATHTRQLSTCPRELI